MKTANEIGGARLFAGAPGAAGVAVRAAMPTSRYRFARRGEHGMVSAEWAVGIIAAIAIAGVLLAVVTSGPVEKAILDFILLVIRAFSRGL